MAYTIHITQKEAFPEAVFEVRVVNEKTTKHRVVVREPYYKRLTGSATSPEDLVWQSFEYLLAHESNTSILPEFDLEAIKRYYPEYEGRMMHGEGDGSDY